MSVLSYLPRGKNCDKEFYYPYLALTNKIKKKTVFENHCFSWIYIYNKAFGAKKPHLGREKKVLMWINPPSKGTMPDAMT